MESDFDIQNFIESRKNYYFKVFTENDIKKFIDGANNFIILSKKFHSLSNPLSFKNRCSKIFLGIAAELVIKATYLKLGYCINKHKDKKKNYSEKKINLFKKNDIKDEELSIDTHSFYDLIIKLSDILPKHNFDFDKDIRKGLEIARIWRNINAHTITSQDIGYGTDYMDIDKSLKILNHLVLRYSIKLQK